MQIRCEDCGAVLEGAGPGMAVLEGEKSCADVMLEHCEMHKLEDSKPPCLVFVILPAEELSVVVELNYD